MPRNKVTELVMTAVSELDNMPIAERLETIRTLAGQHRTHQSMLACLLIFPMVNELAINDHLGQVDGRNEWVCKMAKELVKNAPGEIGDTLKDIHATRLFV